MLYYIVAGDEMQKLMALKFSDRKTIPFAKTSPRENAVALILMRK